MQTQQEQIAVVNQWEQQAPINLANTDHNATLIKAFLADNYQGVFSVAGLNAAVANLHGQLQWLALPTREKGTVAERIANAGGQVTTAHASAKDLLENRQKIEARDQQLRSDIQKKFRYEEFRKKLSDANSFVEANGNRINYSKTQEGRRQLKAALRLEFPEYADQVKD